VVEELRRITGLDLKLSENLVEATQDTGAFVQLSGVFKRIVVKLSKDCNDLRLLSSGPRAGQLQLNVIEPVIAFQLYQSIEVMRNVMIVLPDQCVVGITAN